MHEMREAPQGEAVHPAGVLSTGAQRDAGRWSYRRGMASLSIALADEDAATGVSLVPAAVPESWTGAASSSCQTQLDTLQVLLAGLDPLLETASGAMTALDNASDQCGAIG